MTEDPKYRIYLEEIAALVAKGLSPEQVSSKYDIDLPFLEKCLSDPQFETIFSEIDPNAYESWKSSQNEQISKKRLKSRINEDAPGFYDLVADLVNNKNSSLTDRERCDYALKLAAMSDAARKEVDVEHTVLSEHQIGMIKEALEESCS